jgi:hypothetical protein
MGLPYSQLLTSRKVPAPFVKMLISYFLTYKLKMSKIQIGKALNLNRTTVHHNLKEKIDSKILLSIQKKINDPNFKPSVLTEKVNNTYVKKDRVKHLIFKDKPIKMYGKNLNDIESEISVIVEKMKSANYDEYIEMSRHLDVLSIRKLNADKRKKQKIITVKVSTKKLDEMRSFIG